MTSDGLDPTTVPTPQPPYERMPSDKRHKPKFSMPDGVNNTAEALSEMAIPDSFVKETTKNSNAYCKAQKLTKNQTYNPKKDTITESDVLLFFAGYYYMGVVKCPARRDYWR